MTNNHTGIQIDNLHKIFDNIVALDSINLSISKGKIIGLLGQNGAGKSTLIRLLSGVMRPTKGNATIYGFDLTHQLEDVKRVTGLLPEEYALYEKLTVFEYTNFIATLYDLDDSLFSKRFDKYSELLNLIPLKHRLIETLSKGQKQKVAIIAALIHEPRVLFLDEPLANLDVSAQNIVKELIRSYKSEKRVILIATHLLRNVEEICDDIVLIDEGKILFNDTIQQFQGNFKTLEEAYLTHIPELR